jgi:hypothetical protein
MMRSDIRPEFEKIRFSPARTGVFHIGASRSKWRCLAIIAATSSWLRKDADSKAPGEWSEAINDRMRRRSGDD